MRFWFIIYFFVYVDYDFIWMINDLFYFVYDFMWMVNVLFYLVYVVYDFIWMMNGLFYHLKGKQTERKWLLYFFSLPVLRGLDPCNILFNIVCVNDTKSNIISFLFMLDDDICVYFTSAWLTKFASLLLTNAK